MACGIVAQGGNGSIKWMNVNFFREFDERGFHF